MPTDEWKLSRSRETVMLCRCRLFDQLCAASSSRSAVLAPESSPPHARLGQRRSPRPPPLPRSLCADHDGSSLHAKVLVPAGEP